MTGLQEDMWLVTYMVLKSFILVITMLLIRTMSLSVVRPAQNAGSSEGFRSGLGFWDG